MGFIYWRVLFHSWKKRRLKFSSKRVLYNLSVTSFELL
jgi:hypothetical protein